MQHRQLISGKNLKEVRALSVQEAKKFLDTMREQGLWALLTAHENTSTHTHASARIQLLLLVCGGTNHVPDKYAHSAWVYIC